MLPACGLGRYFDNKEFALFSCSVIKSTNLNTVYRLDPKFSEVRYKQTEETKTRQLFNSRYDQDLYTAIPSSHLYRFYSMAEQE